MIRSSRHSITAARRAHVWHSIILIAHGAIGGGGALAQAPPGAPHRRDYFGTYDRTITALSEPSGAAFASDGRLFISDSTNDRVLAFDADGAPLRDWSDSVGSANSLLAPQGICVAGDGSIFIADCGNDRIVELSPAGRFVRALGSRGSGPGQLCGPCGVALGSEAIVVADTGNDRVQVIGRDGSPRMSVGGFGSAECRFNRPVDVALDGRGFVYVCDADNNRIQKFDSGGKFIKAWGGWGFFPGLLASPSGVAWREGRVFVADAMNHRVQVFDEDGALQYQWGLHVVRPREGEGKLHYPVRVCVAPHGDRAAVCESLEDRVQFFGPLGDAATRPALPTGAEGGTAAHYGKRIAAAGRRLALIEPESHSVLIFDTSQGEPIMICKFGTRGERFGEFVNPTDIAFDPADGMLLVCDRGNRRLQMFRLGPDDAEIIYRPNLARFVKSYDFTAMRTPGAAGELPLSAATIKRDRDGNLYVLDDRNARVCVFDRALKFIRAWGSYGAGDGQFRAPADLSFSRDGATVFVVDAFNLRVQAFDREGKFLYHWGQRGTGDGEFVRPAGIAAGVDGFVYVTDGGLHRVQKFDERGRYVTQWGRNGLGPGELFKPQGLVQDESGRLTVMDWGNHRIQSFTADGQFLSVFGARMYTRPASSRGRQ